MRALHFQPGLPLRLWPMILTTLMNSLNITPNSVAPDSPYYAVFQKVPAIKRLHPFVCRAYWLDSVQNKLNSKAKEGIYVGTEFSRAHIILNPETTRSVCRRDIRVHKNIFPLKNHFLYLPGNNRRVIETALSGAKAIDQELDNMNRHNLWTLVPRSEANGKIMTGKWTLKEKSDRTFKARWCARGFSEPFAIDSYANVLPSTTMRMLLAYASTNDFHIRHVDITAAFLHADIDRPIYIEQPNGREQPGNLV
ncbi:hypothetical protein K3495_g7359 [Podosphaera aphanis]|nr:hypothetical protein K3495_g7359 [Podosphaera aphanis]